LQGFKRNLSISSVVTNASGTVVETLDYFPYGGARTDYKVGTYDGEKNKYAGTQYDSLSSLNYMQARYRSPGRGQFLSEDPSFLAVGDEALVKQMTGREQ
jgi:RHS repeat-associated protein